MIALGTAIHAIACQQAAGVQPRHGEHVRDTLARAFGVDGPVSLRLTPPAGTVVHGAIVVCPYARTAYKQWPADRWNTLIDLLKAEGRQVVIAPEDCSLAALTALLAGAALVVAVDSGPLHLADALGVPVIGLYAATSSVTYGPYHQRERCIDKHAEACEGLGLPYDSSRHVSAGQPMARISVHEVLQRIHAHV